MDAAPWGFAPFHYGRWFQDDGRWGWAPGLGAPGYEVGFGVPRFPIYAPALVSFFTFGAGRPVGWVPLGINEPYFPPYRASLNYTRNINMTNVRNVTSIINIYNIHNAIYRAGTINQFINRGAITVVPGETMARSAPVAVAVVAAPAAFAMRASFRAPVQPEAATLGVAPRRFGGLRSGQPATAPGPIIRAQGRVLPLRPTISAPVDASPANRSPGASGPAPTQPYPPATTPGLGVTRGPELTRPAIQPAVQAQRAPQRALRPVPVQAQPPRPAAQQRPQPQIDPIPLRPQPALRPLPATRPQPGPQAQVRPQAEPRLRPPFQPQPRLQQQPRPQPRLQAQTRPQPQPQPRPQARPAPYPAQQR